MFRFHKPLDIVTLFHKATSPASVRVATLLKQASAAASAHTTEDQASDHTPLASGLGSAAHGGGGSHPLAREQFELNITEDPPTTDQLRTILEYVGNAGISSIVKGASTPNDALRKFKESADNFRRPVVVDWNNGKAAAGDESVILKMLNELHAKDKE